MKWDFPRLLDLPACRFNRAYWPLTGWRFGLVTCSTGILFSWMLPACQRQQKLPSCSYPALLYSALWEAAACVSLIWHGVTGSLELSLACHMSLDGVWVQRLFKHIALPFVRSCTVWLEVKVFTDVCGRIGMYLLPSRVIFSAACLKFLNTICL